MNNQDEQVIQNESGGTDYFDYDLYHAYKHGNFFEKVFNVLKEFSSEDF